MTFDCKRVRDMVGREENTLYQLSFIRVVETWHCVELKGYLCNCLRLNYKN